MLVIRLQRIGKKKQAFFRVVLQEKKWKPQGKIKELLGFYNPHSKEKKLQIEKIKHWISRGAQPSSTIHNMLVDEKIIEGPKVKAWRAKTKKKQVESGKEQEEASKEVSTSPEKNQDSDSSKEDKSEDQKSPKEEDEKDEKIEEDKKDEQKSTDKTSEEVSTSPEVEKKEVKEDKKEN